jgi:hypothetical protein
MRVLIQNNGNGHYLTQHGTWSPLPGHGRDFHFSSCAHALLRKENLAGLRVLFYFEDLDYSIQVTRHRRKALSQDQAAAAFDC